jgi:serine/threonine protein phosphatase PrpC
MSDDDDVVAEPTGWSLSIGFLTDIGRRERNEDVCSLFVPYGERTTKGLVDAIFLVADGMGGHEAGDEASRFAADFVVEALTGPTRPSAMDPPLDVMLEQLLVQANAELVRLARQHGIQRGVGTTLTAAALRDDTLYLAHVGDSRCYRLRDGRLQQLTEDHSWVAEQRRAGLLSAAEEHSHPQRNILTQCLGVDRELDLFIATDLLLHGDRYLLCSDGLHGAVADDGLADVLGSVASPQAAARTLVDLAIFLGSADNITAIVFDVSRGHDDAQHATPARAPANIATCTTLPGHNGSGGSAATTWPDSAALTAAAAPAPRRPRGLAQCAGRVATVLGLFLFLGALAAGAALYLADDSARDSEARPGAAAAAADDSTGLPSDTTTTEVP